MKARYFWLMVVLLGLSTVSIAQWTEDTKPFIDTTFQKANFNNLHGLAVDPNSNVWIQDYGTSPSDSVLVTATGKYVHIRVIHVYKPDGTETSFSPIKFINLPGGVKDTLGGMTLKGAWNGESGRGLGLDKDGNILVSGGGRLYKLDYKTGNGLAKYVDPNDASLTKASSAQDGTIFVANVAQDNPIRMFDNDLNPLGNAVDTARGYSRGFSVSPDGNSIYWAGYTLQKVEIYKRPDAFSPFALTDSLMVGGETESMWQDKRPAFLGDIWMCAGPADAPPTPQSKLSPHTWYLVNPQTKALVDSVKFPGLSATSPIKHRAIGFTKNYDTVYVTAYNNTPAVVRLTRKASSVEREPSGIISNYALSQNFPNPFNPTTEIKFTIAKAGMVTLKVYDVLGKEVATLVNEQLPAGSFNTHFNASGLTSGIYIYQLNAGGVILNNKMTLMK